MHFGVKLKGSVIHTGGEKPKKVALRMGHNRSPSTDGKEPQFFPLVLKTEDRSSVPLIGVADEQQATR